MKSLIKNEGAQAGVGTLIIFIAMVLVAAVAAAVLLQTQGQMNAKSTQTVKAAATAIGENINIVAIDGINNGNTLNSLNITIAGASGSSTVDLSKVLLKVQGQPYYYLAGTAGAFPAIGSGNFSVYILRLSTSGSTSLGSTGLSTWSNSTAPGLDPGSLARLDLNVSSFALGPNTPVTLSLTPQSGATVNNPITLPAFSTSNISIYP